MALSGQVLKYVFEQIHTFWHYVCAVVQISGFWKIAKKTKFWLDGRSTVLSDALTDADGCLRTGNELALGAIICI